jgi:hypothetical protein
MVFFKADLLLGVGVVSAQPRFICTTADFPGGGAAGDANTVDGTAYTVRVIQPEGMGAATVRCSPCRSRIVVPAIT